MNTRSETSFFSLENFGVSAGDKSLVSGINYCPDKPELLVLIGHNGSGKTTMLRAISGEWDHSGTSKRVGGSISYLAQKKDISFNLVVKDLVVMGRYQKKHWAETYSEDDYELVEDALRLFGAGSFAKKTFLELSGGEQQLVWLAMQHIQNAQLYLLDEPTSWLDLRNKRLVLSELASWPEAYGRSVVISTHDIQQLKGCSGQLINLSRKEVVIKELNDETIDEEINFLEQLD